MGAVEGVAEFQTFDIDHVAVRCSWVMKIARDDRLDLKSGRKAAEVNVLAAAVLGCLEIRRLLVRKLKDYPQHRLALR